LEEIESCLEAADTSLTDALRARPEGREEND